jgi:hypothetical protein
MKVLSVTILGTLILIASAFGMGGDKPGPNGGFITMPGTYHVELVLKENKLRVYLLDLSMKNPTTKDSSVSLKLVSTDSKEINCSPEKNYFICNNTNANMEKIKAIEVKSIRNKVVGKIATYKFPLKFEK